MIRVKVLFLPWIFGALATPARAAPLEWRSLLTWQTAVSVRGEHSLYFFKGDYYVDSRRLNKDLLPKLLPLIRDLRQAGPTSEKNCKAGTYQFSVKKQNQSQSESGCFGQARFLHLRQQFILLKKYID